MNDQWVRVTDDDIARAQSLIDSERAHTQSLFISEEDLEANAADNEAAPILRITREDLDHTSPTTADYAQTEVLERYMFQLLIDAREEALPRWLGKARLEWNEKLAGVARSHSADMLHRHYVAHVSPEGQSAAERITRVGISYLACGENIGVFYGEGANSESAIREVHWAFMNQPRRLTNHRGNLMNPIWTHAGIGVVANPKGTLLVTQKFISAPLLRTGNR